MATRRIILAAILALAGCQKAPSGHAPVTDSEATRIATAAEASFMSGNVDAVMSQYDDKAVMIDASSPEPSIDRKQAISRAKIFISMKPADYQVSGRHIQLLGPDAFVSSGVGSFTVAAGAARPTVSARFSDVFQREGDAWKIVHEHVSVPPTATTAP